MPSAVTPREKLLAKVVDYVSEHGVGDRSLRALAAGVGTSHRMLIHHFNSKDGLRAAVVASHGLVSRPLAACCSTCWPQERRTPRGGAMAMLLELVSAAR